MNGRTARIYHRLTDRIIELEREARFLTEVRDELVNLDREARRQDELDRERAAAIREMNGL